jgi:hypothetical protein
MVTRRYRISTQIWDLAEGVSLAVVTLEDIFSVFSLTVTTSIIYRGKAIK